MLQAIIHGKKRANLVRYWEYEDNITSSFFGPLKYFDTNIVCEILRVIFSPYSACEQAAPTGSATLEFWPRLGREPDLLIHIKNVETIKWLHIEVKWNAGESPTGRGTENGYEHQVLAQRNDIKRIHGIKPEQLHSIYLVLDKNRAKEEFNCTIPREINIVSWLEIARRLRDWKPSTPTCVRWRKDTFAYLRKMTGNIFCGFVRGEGKTFQTKEFYLLQHSPSKGKIFFAAFHGFSFTVPQNACRNRDYVFYKVR